MPSASPIFVTVGAQMSFDRLVRAIDQWAAERGRADVFAQIGPTTLRPRHIQWARFLSPAEFRARVGAAGSVVAHAGMGSIIAALEAGVPILVMPRRGSLGETRNDHQVATAERFLALGRVAVARDETELPGKLDQLGSLAPCRRIGPGAQPDLISALRSFIEQPRGRAPAADPALLRVSVPAGPTLT